MKPLLLLVLLGTTTAASAQNRKLDSLQRALRDRLIDKYQHMPNAWGNPNSRVFRLKGHTDSTGAVPFARVKPQVPGVYNLPQDGMPCVVPDTEGIAPIPNASPKVTVPFESTMPNPMDKQGQAQKEPK
jgi:hypothetical protein